MSDESRKDDHDHENEVEAHKWRHAVDEPKAEGEDEGSEVEAHKHRTKHRTKHRA